MENFLLNLFEKISPQMPRSKGHGNGSGTRKQNRNFTFREAKSAQRRPGGVSWAAGSPGSAIITCTWAGWHILKCVELKKTQQNEQNYPLQTQ